MTFGTRKFILTDTAARRGNVNSFVCEMNLEGFPNSAGDLGLVGINFVGTLPTRQLPPLALLMDPVQAAVVPLGARAELTKAMIIFQIPEIGGVDCSPIRWSRIENLSLLKVELKEAGNLNRFALREGETENLHVILEFLVVVAHQPQLSNVPTVSTVPHTRNNTSILRAGKMVLAPNSGGVCHIHCERFDL